MVAIGKKWGQYTLNSLTYPSLYHSVCVLARSLSLGKLFSYPTQYTLMERVDLCTVALLPYCTCGWSPSLVRSNISPPTPANPSDMTYKYSSAVLMAHALHPGTDLIHTARMGRLTCALHIYQASQAAEHSIPLPSISTRAYPPSTYRPRHHPPSSQKSLTRSNPLCFPAFPSTATSH